MSHDALPARQQAWNQAMTCSPGDLSVQAACSGTLPPALIGGRLWSNGPGWTEIGGRLAHPFDGHGYLRRFSFSEQSIHLDACFIETAVYQAERQANRLLYRGLATNTSGRFWENMGITGTPRNVANTTVVPWNDRILVGWEGGHPHAVDPQTLQTLGPHTFDGCIAGQATLAHMHPDPGTDCLQLCSLQQGRSTTVTFREVHRDGTVTTAPPAALPGMAFVHDFAFTDRWHVLGGNPIALKPVAMAGVVLGFRTLMQALRTDLRRPGELVLLSRKDPGVLRRVTLPGSAFVVHFSNAFEQDDTVIVDACVFDQFTFGEEFGYTGPQTPLDPTLPERRGPQRLVRITIPPDATEASWEPLTPHGVDFPRVAPQHRGRNAPFMLGATRADTRYSDPFDSLIRVDLHPGGRQQLWTAPEGQFVGEPIVVPGQGDGHIVALLTDVPHAQTTLVVFDAAHLSDGPIATAHFPLLPIAFHGEWQPPVTQFPA